MRNLSIALIEHKRISTTLAKAKVLRSFLEPIITKSKDNTTHSRRTVFSLIGNKEAVRTGFRLGDGAETALIEFVDYNETYNAGSKSGVAKSSRRGRRRGKSESSTENIVAASVPVAAAVVSEVTPEVDREEEE